MKTYSVHKATKARPLGDRRPFESALIKLTATFPGNATVQERNEAFTVDAEKLDAAFIRHLPHETALRLARMILARATRPA